LSFDGFGWRSVSPAMVFQFALSAMAFTLPVKSVRGNQQSQVILSVIFDRLIRFYLRNPRLITA
jgi:hypothetical protein